MNNFLLLNINQKSSNERQLSEAEWMKLKTPSLNCQSSTYKYV